VPGTLDQCRRGQADTDCGAKKNPAGQELGGVRLESEAFLKIV